MQHNIFYDSVFFGPGTCALLSFFYLTKPRTVKGISKVIQLLLLLLLLLSTMTIIINLFCVFYCFQLSNALQQSASLQANVTRELNRIRELNTNTQSAKDNVTGQRLSNITVLALSLPESCEVVLTFESVDENICCYHSSETSFGSTFATCYLQRFTK